MPQIINTNIASLTAQRNLNSSQSANSTALERLSSGLRINSAKDDAAGLAISTKFESQVKGLNVAIRNAGDGISLAQTAEGALGAMTENLQRIRELAVQSSNATNSDDDRVALQQEVTQLLSEVSRTASETNFNGRNLLDGTFQGTFQIGADAGQTVDVKISELTAEKLGSSATAGVSAIGTNQAIANGDLTINGVAISASKAGSDTASTSLAGASAIAKAAAINEVSDETGVTAYVDKNVASGSEMSATAGTAKIELNGVEINLSTSSDTAQTRAGVIEAINAVSDQTGVMAINTNTDAGGVQLVAADGRNIQLSLDTGDLSGYGSTTTDAERAAATEAFLAASGLTGGLTDVDGAGGENVYSITKTGGFTLVADPDVGSIEITGGNGTGRGDLANAGLTAGTYERGVATSVNQVQTSTVTSSSLASAGGSLTNTIADSGDVATILGAGSDLQNAVFASAASAAGQTAQSAITFRVTSAGGSAGIFSMGAGGTMTSAIDGLDAIAGVDAFERVEFTIQDYSAVTGGNQLYIAGQTINLPDVSGANYDTQTERLQYLSDALNNATYGANITLTAELNMSGNSLTVKIDNRGTAGTVTLGVGSSVNGTGSITGTVAQGSGVTALGNAGLDMSVSAPADVHVIMGAIAFVSTAGVPLTIQAMEGTAGSTASNDFFVGVSSDATSTGSQQLSTTTKNVVSVTVDGVAQADTTIATDSTVAELASTINSTYDDVNAWEEISLTFDNTNLEVGDSLYISSDALGATSGIAVAISDQDSSGSVTIADIAESINTTDFSGENMDVSATLNAAGTEMTLTIRNFSGNEVTMQTDAEGRALELTSGDIVGGVEQQLSGTLAYAATGTQAVSLSISDPESSGDLYTGNAVNSTYSGVNGLDDGDILINGVSIGAAKVGEDTASAEYASDGTRILSSSKELSAIAVAASINEVADETGVSAKVNATEVVGGDGSAITGSSPTVGQFAIGDTAEIFINGYSAGVVTLQDDGAGAIDTDRAKADALDLINGISGKTGVTAVDNGVSLTMSAADGRNVSIAIDDRSGADASIGAMFGMDANVNGIGESTFGDSPAAANNGISAESATYETTYGTITLESAGEFTVALGTEGVDELAALGFQEGAYGGASDGTFLKDIDISTFQGAQDAISAIDNALKTVSSQRAELGALQNRFESTTANLQITSENLAAANSRIRDADFAAETAELSRTQVLQQAGISILAQANQRPQQVLSLLG
ncbi:flagellin [Reinekea sp. G2M2-21]|uniref:flagellin N-terminal helical domain-containing protein n=1 Tax=Reinekea sp. G2M2-21 TaxID=2788942 RepID=UPI0018AA7A21|nr:flagellin [Reinekea sp. G2M2-21]